MSLVPLLLSRHRRTQALRAVTASEALGLPYIPDINSPAHPPFGCGRLYFTIDENSKRNSAYHAFLPSALVRARRANLHICTNALVEKVDIERLPDGRVVARGVVLLSQTGPNPEKRRHVRATREIVLSAGPFGSPHILMLRSVQCLSQDVVTHKTVAGSGPRSISRSWGYQL